MTPTTLDFLGNYNDAVDACPFVLDSSADRADEQDRLVVYKPGIGEVR